MIDLKTRFEDTMTEVYNKVYAGCRNAVFNILVNKKHLNFKYIVKFKLQSFGKLDSKMKVQINFLNFRL